MRIPSLRVRGLDALRQADLGRATVWDDDSLMALYSQDQARLPKTFRSMIKAPRAVVQPQDAEAVVKTLAWAERQGMAVVPRGAGSNAFGGSLSLGPCLVLDTRRLDGVRAVHDGTAWVEGGATWNHVMAALASHGVRPRVHTTSQFSTVAGMAATGGIGLGCTRWGWMQENVVAVELATPEGLRTLAIEDAAHLFRTDGQFGVMTALQLRTRPVPALEATVLKQFGSYQEAIDAARTFAGMDGIQTVLCYDKARVHELNAVVGRAMVPEKATLVARFEGDDLELPESDVEPGVVGFVWEQRHFPMRPLKLGPGLLGAEAILPDREVQRFADWGKRALSPFGLTPANEAYVMPDGQVLNITTFLTDAKAKGYTLHVAQVARLTKKAAKLGGTPYGGGLWNLPFAKKRHGDLGALRARKRQEDPGGILNPGKSLQPPSRSSKAGLFLRTPLGTLGPSASRLLAAGARYKARPIQPAVVNVAHPGSNHPDNIHGRVEADALEAHDYSHQACTQCAACVPVCPAWQHTGDDRTTARGKLQFMDRLAADPEAVSADEAAALYQCIRCRACEEVCQTDLPLLAAFESLEARLTDRFGFPTERVVKFLDGVEADEKAQRVIDETRGIFGPHALLEVAHG